MNEEFYNGFYIKEVRNMGDRSTVSRVVGYRAVSSRGVSFSNSSKRALKKEIRTYLEKRSGSVNDILNSWKHL